MDTRSITYDREHFEFLRRCVIYVESEKDQCYTEFIQNRLDELCDSFRKIGYKFFYLTPSSVRIDDDIVRYYEPAISASLRNESVLTFNIERYLQTLLKESDPVEGPCLLYRFDPYGWCTCIRLRRNCPSPSHELNVAIQYIDDETKERYRNSPVFDIRRCPDEPETVLADINFNMEVFRAIEEIQKYTKFLEERGVYLSVLGSSVSVHGTLSTLVIQKDYSITLPEYDMTFKLEPLPMSVYMLFLNHPEGIMFKELAMYRKELMRIYGKMTGRSEPEQITRSIANLTDPMKNSINEKCSVIRREFVKRFNESLATNYIITGRKGEPKKILLPRDMVKILCL